MMDMSRPRLRTTDANVTANEHGIANEQHHRVHRMIGIPELLRSNTLFLKYFLRVMLKLTRF
jgi:hypothetical protein